MSLLDKIKTSYNCLGIKKNLILLSIIPVLFCVLFVYFEDFKTKYSNTINKSETIVEIVQNRTVSQDFICEYDGLSSVNIYISTFARMNHCTLVAKLFADDELIQVWEIDCKQLADNSYYPLKLDKTIKDSKGMNFHLFFESDGVEGNSVTIYKNTSGEYSGLYIFDNKVEGESLCYQLQYSTVTDARAEKILVIFFSVCVLILVSWIIMNQFEISIVKRFLLLWVLLSLLFSISNTPFNTPDEPSHFCRAYEISLGYLVSDYNDEDNVGGRELPLDVNFDLLKNDWQSFYENRNMSITENWVFRHFSYIAVYSPVSYFPQACGIYFSRLFTSNIPIIFYSGRFVNWLCITLLLCITLKLLPVGKEFFSLVLLMPMNIHEAVSLATDGMVVALSAFVVAFVLFLRNRKAKLKWYYVFILYTIAIVISLYKIVYFPFTLFYLLIPSESFKNGKWGKLLHGFLVVLLVCVASFSWLKICNKFLVYPGSDSKVQLQYIFSHPFNYFIAFCRTLISNTSTLIFRMVGDSLAWLNVSTVGIFALIYILVLVKKTNGFKLHGNKDLTGIKIVSGIVVIIIVLLTYTAEYLTWTNVYSNIISGLQGRYFIDLLLPFFLLMTKDNPFLYKNESVSLNSQWIVMLINICACGSLMFSCLRN